MVRTIQTLIGSVRSGYIFKQSENNDTITQINQPRHSDEVIAADRITNATLSLDVIECVVGDCTRRAVFAGAEGEDASHCAAHSFNKGMVRVVQKSCAIWNCNAPGLFIYPSRKSILRYCEDHKQSSMILHQSVKCSIVSCERLSNFNCKDDKQRQFCTSHKDGVKRIGRRPSTSKGCLPCPQPIVYGFPGRNATKCSRHKMDGMVIVVHNNQKVTRSSGSVHKKRRGNVCIEDGCSRRHSFGIDGGKPQYCLEHAKEGMVNVVSPRCTFEGCLKRRLYGWDLVGNKPEYCSEHSKEGMVSYRKRKRNDSQVLPVHTSNSGYDTEDDPEVEQMDEPTKRRLLVAL